MIDRERLVHEAARITAKECRRLGVQCWKRGGREYTDEAQEIFNRAYDAVEAHLSPPRQARNPQDRLAPRGVYVGNMEFAGYRVTAIGTNKTEVMNAIRKSITSSVYWKDSEWHGRPWSEAWSYFSGHIEFMKYGHAEWH